MIGPTSQSPIHRFPGRWRDPSQFRDEVASGHMPAVSCSSCLRVFPRSWRPMGTICWASSFIATESGAFRINSNTTKVLWATFGLCCVFFCRVPTHACKLWGSREFYVHFCGCQGNLEWEKEPHTNQSSILPGDGISGRPTLHKHINNRWQPHSNMM